VSDAGKSKRDEDMYVYRGGSCSEVSTSGSGLPKYILSSSIIIIFNLLVRSWLIDEHSPIVEVMVVEALGAVAVVLSLGRVGEERSSDGGGGGESVHHHLHVGNDCCL